MRAALAPSDAYVKKAKAADLLVLGASRYDYGMPSTLKAWGCSSKLFTRLSKLYGARPVGQPGAASDRRARGVPGVKKAPCGRPGRAWYGPC